MDGVLVHEEQALPGASEFLAALQEHGRRFLVLTNNSLFTARDLVHILGRPPITLNEVDPIAREATGLHVLAKADSGRSVVSQSEFFGRLLC